MAEKIYSEIPMRTWRWLGVNEAKADEAVLAIDNGRQELVVPAGESRQLTVVYRQAGEGQVQVKVEKGGFLKLTTVQLMPVDAQGASSVQVELADTAELEAVAVEAGSAKSLAKMEVNLSGNESKANVYVLYFGHGASQLDMNYVLVQQGKNTEANLHVYGALLGEANKIFRGTLDFRHGSKGSKGYEKEEVVVLSSKVRNRSVPLMLSAED
ncbi:MAG: SufD family Fe-S cluster assembly protein, partial [Anaerovibrio sp.]|nr:SufD family Fe-S cluster assembly protein [Anaerovibrio sp.]